MVLKMAKWRERNEMPCENKWREITSKCEEFESHTHISQKNSSTIRFHFVVLLSLFHCRSVSLSRSHENCIHIKCLAQHSIYKGSSFPANDNRWPWTQTISPYFRSHQTNTNANENRTEQQAYVGVVYKWEKMTTKWKSEEEKKFVHMRNTNKERTRTFSRVPNAMRVFEFVKFGMFFMSSHWQSHGKWINFFHFVFFCVVALLLLLFASSSRMFTSVVDCTLSVRLRFGSFVRFQFIICPIRKHLHATQIHRKPKHAEHKNEIYTSMLHTNIPTSQSKSFWKLRTSVKETFWQGRKKIITTRSLRNDRRCEKNITVKWRKHVKRKGGKMKDIKKKRATRNKKNYAKWGVFFSRAY